METEQQRSLFSAAIEQLGGAKRTGKLLGISDRNVRYLRAGTNRLHDGLLEDLCKALIAQADAARALERQLNPGFTANRNPLQHVPRHADPARFKGSD